jgi:hypothetical protein
MSNSEQLTSIRRLLLGSSRIIREPPYRRSATSREAYRNAALGFKRATQVVSTRTLDTAKREVLQTFGLWSSITRISVLSGLVTSLGQGIRDWRKPAPASFSDAGLFRLASGHQEHSPD